MKLCTVLLLSRQSRQLERSVPVWVLQQHPSHDITHSHMTTCIHHTQSHDHMLTLQNITHCNMTTCMNHMTSHALLHNVPCAYHMHTSNSHMTTCIHQTQSHDHMHTSHTVTWPHAYITHSHMTTCIHHTVT